MLNFLFPKKVPQTGLITRPPSPTDRLAGATVKEVRLANGIWTSYRPISEVQFKKFSFDTMSCASFSANNCVEYQVNWMLQNNKISPELKAWLNSNGYLEDGVLNLSDRFTAIMSGTTKQGNYFQAVWDSIRNNGVIPERELPFGGDSFDEYHDATKITQAHRDLGKEWIKRFQTEYEWVTFDNNPDFTVDQVAICKEFLQYAPLNIAIPVPSTHAITLESIQDPTLTVFDQYPPFVNINQINYQIHYAMIGYVSLVTTPINQARPTVKLGSTGKDVEYLQSSLKNLGYTDIKIVDGKFGPQTQKAVKLFQKHKKLTQDGIVGKNTWKALDEALKKKTVSSKGLEIIKEFEGLRLKPYKDTGGVWTIGYTGYGATTDLDGNPITQNTKPITKEQADLLLKYHVRTVEDAIARLVKVQITQNQFDALASFIFNIGETQFKGSSLLRKLNAGEDILKRNFTDWKYDNGKIIPGLLKRREKEYELFMTK